ncbi:diguanylate cyclase domain-containing protein [Onishia niordana]|uniref:diguanylate cyclase domain-containing protein n=1 Tax=Onishia niordana TaxID=2508711 RepID=UPI00144875F6|nr:diguanylate cyclase [Halomonas niordiana]
MALIALAAFTRYSLMPELLRIEDMQGKESLERAQRAIDNELRHLEVLSKDWAAWDDSYRFMQDGNLQFLASNINGAAIFTDANLNLIAFFTPSGMPFWLGGLDPTMGQYRNCNERRASCQWTRTFLETVQKRIEQSTQDTGMTWLQTKPQMALVSIQPIVRSDGSGPIAGWLAMARPMSEDWLQKLRNSTGLAATVHNATGTVPPPSLQRINEDIMRASRLIPATPAGEELTLAIDLPRQHLNMSVEAFEMGLAWTVCLIALVVLVVLWLLERIVLNPLRLFAAFTHRAKQADRTDVPASLQKRKDEIGALARHFQQLIEFQRKQTADLVQLSEHDPLTGLANRRRFDEHLSISLATDSHLQQPTALIMMDIDHFKAFNDRFGHPTGDTCLQTLAGVMSEHFDRADQLVARTGGEEFTAILPGTSQQAALACADRLREAIEALAVPHTDQVVTISAGVACSVFEHPLDAAALIEAADRALYAAKEAGRNRVMAASEPDYV